ncbi:hypothetical protein ACP6PL_27570 [Dapis sp. BLCC M126]
MVKKLPNINTLNILIFNKAYNCGMYLSDRVMNQALMLVGE